MDFRKLTKFFQFDTAGWIATSGLLVCVLSGVFLAVPYDFTRAHQSVSEILLLNPPGSFIRNLHYWSAQLFFIFTVLHIYDHLHKSTETNIRNKRTWLVLCIAIFFLGYEMISGFILKGDAGGIQARRIFASMLSSVPFIGNVLSTALSGTEDNTQIVYIQHVALGTILLMIGVYDHLRTIWPRIRTFMVVLVFLFVVGLIFRAPLGLVESSAIKGPWFFIGIQELLHLTSHPGTVVLLFGLLFVVFYLLPRIAKNFRMKVKIVLLSTAVTYLVLTLFVLVFRGDNWQWQGLNEENRSNEQLLIFDPVNLSAKVELKFAQENQKTEGCMLCHSAITGLSDSHKPSFIGCFACHKGDPFSSDKSEAHSKMIKIPGNFSNVRQTCGTQNCHQEIAGRMLNSLMTTQSGIIGVDKFVFGETTSLNDTFQVRNLGHSAADNHLRNLCAGCHLGKEKEQTGNATWLERGGGCNACHLNYSRPALASMDSMKTKTLTVKNEVHPTINIQVSNDRCKSCHSRSGRISLSYEGWNETDLKITEVADTSNFKVLPDERVVEFIQSDIHHKKGMVCIDCHGSYEMMGDGKHPIHKEDAVYVQCIDCHPTRKPNTSRIVKLPDRESLMIAWLRKYPTKNKVVLTAKGNNPLINTNVDSVGQIILTDKLTGKNHISKPAAPVCIKGKGHERLSCESCHTAWVPRCIGCHTAYEKETLGFDLLTNKTTSGTWVEYAGKNFAQAPTLGISEKGGGKIIPTMPGMVMTIDKESFSAGKGSSFHRLYGPASGHTTVKEGRSCKSCHNNPVAFGFGEGDLNFLSSGAASKWEFTPKFAPSKQDGLPEDAWTGFLKESKLPNSTRIDLRPFTIKEQLRILEVGSCLTCHDDKSKVMERTLEDFEKTVAGRSDRCKLYQPEILQ